ncbi:MAG: PEGA domain-containing protein, partial [Spirochaetaceae bacterium]|nr:PEGA domain-containing protein [Spirochaetaceae bacterium]
GSGMTSANAQIEGIFEELGARIRVETEESGAVGAAALEVESTAANAEVFVNRVNVGKAPYSAETLAPGSYLIEVKAVGYRELSLSLALSEKIVYTVTFDLELLTGNLQLFVQPEDARAIIGETIVQSGVTELPIGSYKLLVSRFGYVGKETIFKIREDQATRLDIVLEEAAFDVSGFHSSRRSFNPRNPGAPGRTEFSFDATNRGTATVSVVAKDGSELATIDYPVFDTWRQRASWDGKAADGRVLPDGEYIAKLRAQPLPDVLSVAATALVAETLVAIDSSLVVRAIGTASAVPGLAYFPDPRSLPAGTMVAETSWFAPLDGIERSALGLSASLALGWRSSLSLSATAELGGAEGGTSKGAAASFALSLGRDPDAPLSAAVFLRASFDDAPSPAMPGSRDGIEASFPIALALGSREGGFSLGASPGLVLDFRSGSLAALALARAGLWGELPGLRAGLSGELAFLAADGAFAPDWPAHAAAEARLMLAPSPFVASIYALVDLEPGASPRWGAGLGLGLMF